MSVRANQEQELFHPLSTPKSSGSRGAEEPLVAVVHLQGGQLLQGDLQGLLKGGGPLAPSPAGKEASSCKTNLKLSSKGNQGQQLGLVKDMLKTLLGLLQYHKIDFFSRNLSWLKLQALPKKQNHLCGGD